MNIRRLLIAAEIHFVHLVERQLKTSQVDTKLCQLQQSKQVSRCCINFQHELTCQIRA